jgi:predicted dehydrogenase
MIYTAVIGAGYWGTNIIRVLSELSSLKYICDLDINLLNRKYGENKKFVDTTLTSDMLDIMYDPEVEAVFIVTPPETHAGIAITALNNSKHVFIEKPMTATSKEADSLIKLSNKKKLKLGVGHTFLYSAPVIKTKEIIDSGELGDILHIDMSRKNLGKFQAHCDVIYDLAPHDFSMLLYWFPEFSIKSANVSLFGHFKGLQQDTSNIDILSTNGMTVALSYSWIYPYKVRDT